jgi:hypothetical protein
VGHPLLPPCSLRCRIKGQTRSKKMIIIGAGISNRRDTRPLGGADQAAELFSLIPRIIGSASQAPASAAPPHGPVGAPDSLSRRIPTGGLVVAYGASQLSVTGASCLTRYRHAAVQCADPDGGCCQAILAAVLC